MRDHASREKLTIRLQLFCCCLFLDRVSLCNNLSCAGTISCRPEWPGTQ